MALQVGIQLYSVRQHMAKDPIGTIEKVAEIGYKYIELANHTAYDDAGCGFGISTDRFMALMERLGMKVCSSHVMPFDQKNAQAVVEFNKAVGSEGIVCPIGYFKDKADVLEQCKELNKMGEICKKAGLEYYYHNHFHEFQVFEGKTVMDLIMENTDPELVSIEYDTYWGMRGGMDPAAFIKKAGKRCKLLHQKDFPKDAPNVCNVFDELPMDTLIDEPMYQNYHKLEDFAEVGTGIMDLQQIIDTAIEVGAVKYIILEQDFTRLDEIESVTISYNSFKKCKNIIL